MRSIQLIRLVGLLLIHRMLAGIADVFNFLFADNLVIQICVVPAKDILTLK